MSRAYMHSANVRETSHSIATSQKSLSVYGSTFSFSGNSLRWESRRVCSLAEAASQRFRASLGNIDWNLFFSAQSRYAPWRDNGES